MQDDATYLKIKPPIFKCIKRVVKINHIRSHCWENWIWFINLMQKFREMHASKCTMLQIFREINSLWNNFTEKMLIFSKNRDCVFVILSPTPMCCFHSRAQCSVAKREILSYWKFFVKSTTYLVISLDSKTIAFTKFFRKKYEREFLQFPHCVDVKVKSCIFLTVHWFHGKIKDYNFVKSKLNSKLNSRFFR